MIIVSSEERMLISKLLSSADHDNAESVSIDFCESQLKDYSVMMVSTYSRDLRQLVPLHQFIFQKPGESADNVELALKKVDERMLLILTRSNGPQTTVGLLKMGSLE